MKHRIIINGKFSDNYQLRQIIEKLKTMYELDVRVSWESGDISDFCREAADGYKRVIVAGGDGSMNEAVTGLMDIHDPPELAIVPMGTANDLAVCAGMPVELEESFLFAFKQEAVSVDVIQVNDRFIMNTAALGQAAKVTERTPDMLKGLVGKFAYSLSSLISFFDVTDPVPFKDNFENDNEYIFGYICNGSSCGGGFQISPTARINDGQMDILLIKHFDLTNIANVTFDLWQNNENEYIKRFRTDEIYLEAKNTLQISIDGEIYSSDKFYFKCRENALKLVVNSESELISESSCYNGEKFIPNALNSALN